MYVRTNFQLHKWIVGKYVSHLFTQLNVTASISPALVRDNKKKSETIQIDFIVQDHEQRQGVWSV